MHLPCCRLLISNFLASSTNRLISEQGTMEWMQRTFCLFVIKFFRFLCTHVSVIYSFVYRIVGIFRTFYTHECMHACMLQKGCYSAKIKSPKTFLTNGHSPKQKFILSKYTRYTYNIMWYGSQCYVQVIVSRSKQPSALYMACCITTM